MRSPFPSSSHCAALAIALLVLNVAAAQNHSTEDVAFFEAKIRPVLERQCLECHSSAKRKGELALDHRDGLLRGGESGPAIVPGKPQESTLISALRHESFEMPPDKRLGDAVIADFTRWIERGAVDPRGNPPAASPSGEDWEATYQQRLKWWSLQSVEPVVPPSVKNANWPQNEVDHFILHALEAKGLSPAPRASIRTLARRLSFALTGLPPSERDVERLEQSALRNPRSAVLAYVDTLLASHHFGEHWARHWMDVVHYADTHGYEWDIPAKNAWRYRDYLIRAFNADMPYDQLVREHLAGDLLDEPRSGPDGVNESLIGPMSLRLGERRHGDNGSVIAGGVTEEAVDNTIDTISKAFLATTVACAQCHHHKLDAIAQHDYYALAGTLSSSRFVVRSIDAQRHNAAAIAELRAIKAKVRAELAALWLKSLDELPQRMSTMSTGVPPDGSFPATPLAFWQAICAAPEGEVAARWEALAKQHAQLQDQRAKHNSGLTLIADFTQPQIPPGWQMEGEGLRSGLAASGEFVVADEGAAAIAQILPAGRWTHVWSQRLGGAVRGPLMDRWAWPNIVVGSAGASGAARMLIVENALFPEEQMTYLKQPQFGWLSVPTKAGRHRVYVELSTKAYNNNFPPRVGLSPGGEDDPRSWFGLTKIYAVSTPADELARFAPLFSGAEPPQTRATAAVRIAAWLKAVVERWRDGRTTDEEALLLNGLVAEKLLPNDASRSPKLKRLVDDYRAAEKHIHPDRTVGSMIDMREGRDERLRVRGDYGQFAEPAPRGNIRFLSASAEAPRASSSGRLELARNWSDPQNPLVARVMVNRIWLHLFGQGLVRTPDDFGHLGERPSHPELLDWLAARYVAEGWSTKKLIRLLVSSAVWQQSGEVNAVCGKADPENRLWHHMPVRRLDAESIRDTLLAVAGRLDRTLYGPPIEPYRAAADPEKRLAVGPLDGRGRRSIYLRMTLMEPPRFLALFNQPIPKQTVGQRDVTNVPDQSLAMLNDPFVHAMAQHWAERIVADGATSADARVRAMFVQGLGRAATNDEAARLVQLANRSAELRDVPRAAMLGDERVWHDVAHALYNLKEFIYIP